jgi:hypothetical protein
MLTGISICFLFFQIFTEWLILTLKGSLISHGAHRELRESRFSHDTPEIAYLAPPGRTITLRGIVYGKGFRRKKECILFSLNTFPHKTVSNHPLLNLLRGLWGLLKALSDAEGERLLSKIEGAPR